MSSQAAKPAHPPPTISTPGGSAAPPPPNLHLGHGRLLHVDNSNNDSDDYLRDDNDDLMLSEHGAGGRRPSTASLSRFRSCPQLASVMNMSQDSPGYDMAPMTDSEGNMLHTKPTSNKPSNNTLQVERPRFEMTSTPTPPSTPGSRRKEFTRSQSQHSNGNSPSSTPKLSRRCFAEQGLIPRTESCDSQAVEGAMYSSGSALTTENLMKLDELYLQETLSKRQSFYEDASQADDQASDVDDASSMHLCGRHSQRHILQHPDHHLQLPPHQNQAQQQQQHQQQQQLLYPGDGDDGVEKCSRWLQGLKLTKSDKIKSRSHIQLPAI